MARFSDLKLSDDSPVSIQWDMTPDLAFCMFSAKGMREELRNSGDRVCYFFIDNYGEQPKLYLMERGSRFVDIIAEIHAPQELLNDCILRQGKTLNVKDNFAVDGALKEWILTEVVNKEESSVLYPVAPDEEAVEDMGLSLAQPGTVKMEFPRITLADGPCLLSDEQIKDLILGSCFADQVLNPNGRFVNYFADSGNDFTVIDERSSLMWQRFGLDLCSIRSMKNKVEELNKKSFAGYHDWRMPSIEEALSIMEAEPNRKGVFLHPCFSREQPFIFTTAKRKPTGYWFVDYKQGKVYWSSGTVPGGFARLCRGI
ncbi:MAG: hypothetical protein DSY80_04145 [Desulfocapsa sp.]|nr:MAG: hypothetical protein DSY80_04145 [Desulfocapsa sp.]